MPSRPSSPICATTASGIHLSFSHCAACGANSFFAKSRAISRIMRWSSVKKSWLAFMSMVTLSGCFAPFWIVSAGRKGDRAAYECRPPLFAAVFDFFARVFGLLVDGGLYALGLVERLHLCSPDRVAGTVQGAAGRAHFADRAHQAGDKGEGTLAAMKMRGKRRNGAHGAEHIGVHHFIEGVAGRCTDTLGTRAVNAGNINADIDGQRFAMRTETRKILGPGDIEREHFGA